METISVTISTKDTEVLRKTADYFRDLAGESVAQVTGGPIEVELDPEKEAEEMGTRIDDVVATAGAAELDIDGRPWDVRIDSSAKSKTTDGRWKIARNKDRALVEQIKAELLSVAPVVAPVVVAPVVAPVVVAPPIETPAAITTYVPLINRITAVSKTDPPTLQKHDVMDALNSSGAFLAGATTLTELSKPEYAGYIPLVAAELEKLWATRA